MKLSGKLIDIVCRQKPLLTFEIEGSPAGIEKYMDAVLDITIAKHRKKRSLDANACLWWCLEQISAKTNRPKWDCYIEALRNYGKSTYIVIDEKALEALKRQWREIEVIGDKLALDETGEPIRMKEVLCYFGSSTYDSKEFSDLINGVVADMEDLGLEPPLRADIRAMMEEYDEKRSNG